MPISVELHGRAFRRFLSADAIAGRISKLSLELAAHLDIAPSLSVAKPPLFIGILNGAAIFHADLTRSCDFALEIAYLRTRSYQGLTSSGEVAIDWPADLNVQDRHVVIVEDIVDSGLTLHTLTQELRDQRGVAGLTTIALLDKPEAHTTPFRPDFIGFTIPNSFVVGYGLDYDGLGRNLPDIYQLAE